MHSYETFQVDTAQREDALGTQQLSIQVQVVSSHFKLPTKMGQVQYRSNFELESGNV